MPALRPLFAAAGVLLLIALVVLAVRSTDDPAVPSAGGTISPGETATDAPDDPTDLATTGLPTPTESPDDEPTATETATDTPTDDTTTDDGTTTGTGGSGTGSGTGSEGTGSGSEGTDSGSEGTGSGSEGTGSEGTGSEDDEDDRDVVAIGDTGSDVDDMPDTGGGAASVLVGLVALGGSTALSRRR